MIYNQKELDEADRWVEEKIQKSDITKEVKKLVAQVLSGEKKVLKKELPPLPSGGVESAEKKFDDWHRIFTAVVSASISGRKRKSYFNEEALYTKTGLSKDLFAILKECGGAEKNVMKGGKIYIFIRQSFEKCLERFNELFLTFVERDKNKTRRIDQADKRERLLVEGLKLQRREHKKELGEVRSNYESRLETLRNTLRQSKTRFTNKLETVERELEQAGVQLRDKEDMEGILEGENAELKGKLKKLEEVLKREQKVGGRGEVKIDMEKLRDLKELGWSNRQIGRHFGISHHTVKRRLEELERT